MTEGGRQVSFNSLFEMPPPSASSTWNPPTHGLSILYLRCWYNEIYGDGPDCVCELSILYLRCWGCASRRRLGAGAWGLSILYLRCLPPRRLGVVVYDWGLSILYLRCRANCGESSWLSQSPLSILYLRCCLKRWPYGPYATNIFQFSI